MNNHISMCRCEGPIYKIWKHGCTSLKYAWFFMFRAITRATWVGNHVRPMEWRCQVLGWGIKWGRGGGTLKPKCWWWIQHPWGWTTIQGGQPERLLGLGRMKGGSPLLVNVPQMHMGVLQSQTFVHTWGTITHPLTFTSYVVFRFCRLLACWWGLGALVSIPICGA